MTYPKEFNSLSTPVYVTDLHKLKENTEILNSVQIKTGAKILLALKAFAQYSTFPLLSRSFSGPLYGCCASSLNEAKLAKEEFKGEVHIFATAYSNNEIEEILLYCDHIIFNSFYQLETFLPYILEYNKKNTNKIEVGLRINPEYSEGTTALYDPCAETSRLGIRSKDFKPEMLEHISGLHFHTLCEQDADALERTLDIVLKKFGKYFKQMKWINFGGGHHITRVGYDIDLLCECITKIKKEYDVEIYLEPGEAVALNAGYFISTVLDKVQADIPTLILDCSATCHMPDVLEMPYTPSIFNATIHQDLMPITKNTYRLAGKSCLAGDIIGIYTFDNEIAQGDKIVFKDMAIYSMVKNTTFNGISLPDIARYENNKVTIDKKFTYEDFKRRL